MRLPLLHPACVAVFGGLALLPSGPLAQAADGKSAADNADAVAACERAARQSLASRATQAAEVKFAGRPTAQPHLSSDSQIVLQGAGSWRAASGMRSFAYRCNVDLRTPEAVGLVIRDTTPVPRQATTARKGIEPDLSHLSPAACESSAAAALKRRWPRVSQISFDTSTRSLLQESASKAELHGQGLALPAPGAPAAHFSFDCEIDPRDGRVIATRISG
jgi:hypothetical protein